MFKSLVRTSCGLLLAMALMLEAGCSLYRNDSAYVPREQYLYARDYFIQTGSLDLVERHLQDLQWERPQINEALYRLGKEFKVLPETPPAKP